MTSTCSSRTTPDSASEQWFQFPSLNKKALMSIRSDYDCSFGVRATQLWNALPLDSFKIGLGMFLEQYPDNPPVHGYTPANDNSLLNCRWKPDARTAELTEMYRNLPKCMYVFQMCTNRAPTVCGPLYGILTYCPNDILKCWISKFILRANHQPPF